MQVIALLCTSCRVNLIFEPVERNFLRDCLFLIRLGLFIYLFIGVAPIFLIPRLLCGPSTSSGLPLSRALTKQQERNLICLSRGNNSGGTSSSYKKQWSAGVTCSPERSKFCAFCLALSSLHTGPFCFFLPAGDDE